MVALPGLLDRHGVQLELVAQYSVCRLAPNRDVEPQETIATLTQRRQFSKIVFTNARRRPTVPDLIAGSRHTSKPTTTIRSRSYGPPRQRRSWRKSAEAGSHSDQSRLINETPHRHLTNSLALMTDGDWRDGGFRQRRPSVETLAWVAASMGRGSRIVGYRRLTGGVCSAVNRLTVERGGSLRLPTG